MNTYTAIDIKSQDHNYVQELLEEILGKCITVDELIEEGVMLFWDETNEKIWKVLLPPSKQGEYVISVLDIDEIKKEPMEML